MKQPQNESETHFILKEISKYILFNMGYTRLATEVGGMYSCDDNDLTRNKKGGLKETIDAIGIKKVSKLIPHSGYQYSHRWVLCGIEAKASLSDFRNGFCMAPSLTYVIAPCGVIPHEEIPKKIGLIEVDIPNVKIQKQVNKPGSIQGINVTVRAKSRLDSRFKDKDTYQEFCSKTLENIAYKATTELLFWRNIIELKK